jgi:hypothetical protein
MSHKFKIGDVVNYRPVSRVPQLRVSPGLLLFANRRARRQLELQGASKNCNTESLAAQA